MCLDKFRRLNHEWLINSRPRYILNIHLCLHLLQGELLGLFLWNRGARGEFVRTDLLEVSHLSRGDLLLLTIVIGANNMDAAAH